MKNIGQLRQEGQVGTAHAPLPLADGLVADAHPLRQLALGQPPLLPQAADQSADLGVVHVPCLLFRLAVYAASPTAVHGAYYTGCPTEKAIYAP